MPAKNPVQKFENPRLAGVLLAALLLVFTLALSWQSWRETKAAEIRNLKALSAIGSASVNAYFLDMERALDLLGQDIGHQPGAWTPQHAYSLLARFKRAYPDLSLLVVIRPDGQVLANAAKPPGEPLSFQDTPSFKSGVADLLAGQSMNIGRPLVNPTNPQEWIIPMRYGVRDAKGRLQLIISASLPLDRPQSLWRNAPLAPGQALGLRRDDGYMASRFPVPASASMESIYGTPPAGVLDGYIKREYAREKRFPSSGIVEGTSAVSGTGNIFVFNRLPNYPISFFVTTPLSNLVSTWWKNIRITYLMAALLMAGGIAVFVWSEWRRRLWDAQRLTMEQSLRNSQARTEGIISSAMDAIISIDADHRIILFNDAAETMFGYSVHEMIGRPLDDLIPERFRQKHPRYVNDFGAAEKPTRRMGGAALVAALRADGGEFPVEASISRLRLGNENIYTVIMRDVTERQLAEAKIQSINASLTEQTNRLADANKELEAFSYSVSHDLRAPLRGIDGWSLAAIEDYGPQLDKTGRGYLEKVRAEASRMGQLIDAMLGLAQTLRAEIKYQPVDLTAHAQAAIATLRKTDPTRSVDILIADGLGCEGDPILLNTVLENLLGNAWKFTGRSDRARIEFGAAQIEGETVFHVRDNGAGFDEAHAAKLFGAFQRLHRSSEFEGTGIGLVNVQRILRRHGGRIWAKAKPNEGATFFFTIGKSK
jgi:PAS domain S-box-containing protein